MDGKSKYPWIVARDGTHGKLAYAMECVRCGTIQPITLPLSVDGYVAMARGFKKYHRYCRESQTRKPRRGTKD